MRFTCVSALIAVALAASACAGGHRAGEPPPPTHSSASHSAKPPGGSVVSARMVSSWRLIDGGRVRCTATVSRSVQAGNALGLTFAVRNISASPVEVDVQAGGLWLVVRAADGTTYDTRVPLRSEIGPVLGATRISPGTTKSVPVGRYLRVRWRGPLRVTPGCGQSALPVLRVGVDAPGPPQDDRTAVADVVAASGHLLDHCRPKLAGVPVQGRIYSPDRSAPPMSATCSVSLRHEGRFLVAQALVVTPPGLGYVRIRQPYVEVTTAHARPPNEASVWEFVVTRDATIPVASAGAEATRPDKRWATDWSLIGSQWKRQGGSRCGGSGEEWGGAEPTIEFISPCPA